MGSYHDHQVLIKKFKILAQKEFPKIRVFDRHVGLFFTFNKTPIKINQKGMADCYAIISTDNGLIHAELEFKTGKARLSKEQKLWQAFIESMNGIYILVRDEYDGVAELKKMLTEKNKI